MHVRLAPAAGGRRITFFPRRRLRRTLPPLLVALNACWFLTACDRSAPARDVALEWTLAPSPPVVGPSTLTLRCLDEDRQPVAGAAIRVEGHMSHPGMAPVVAEASERGPGTYEADLRFTMPGDWILVVSSTLSSGGTFRQQIDVPGVQPSPE